MKNSYETEILKMEEVKISLKKELEDIFKNVSEEEVWRTKYEDVWRKMSVLEEENCNMRNMLHNLDLELKKKIEERKELVETTERRVKN